jgi:hypothetical protein
VRRALGVAAIAVVAVLVPSCSSAIRSKLDAAQCSLLSSADVGRAVGANSPPGALFDHEVDGDGTWCRFDTTAGSLETRFQPEQPADFAALRTACLRDGSASQDVGPPSDALTFCTNGIPSAIGFTRGYVITVHSLAVPLDITRAEAVTTAVATTALSQCCPTT